MKCRGLLREGKGQQPEGNKGEAKYARGKGLRRTWREPGQRNEAAQREDPRARSTVLWLSLFDPWIHTGNAERLHPGKCLALGREM